MIKLLNIILCYINYIFMKLMLLAKQKIGSYLQFHDFHPVLVKISCILKLCGSSIFELIPAFQIHMFCTSLLFLFFVLLEFHQIMPKLILFVFLLFSFF